MTTLILRPTPPVQPEGAAYSDTIVRQLDNLGQTIDAKIPTFQTAIHEYTKSTTTFSINNLPAQPFGTGNAAIEVMLPQANCIRLVGVALEVNITLANANAPIINSAGASVPNNQTVLASTLTWFKRIDINSSVNTLLFTTYPDVNIADMMIRFNNGNMWSKFAQYNLNATASATFAGVTPALLPGQQLPFYIPLNNNFITENLALWWSRATTPLTFNLFPESTIVVNSGLGPNGLPLSGASTAITLNSMRMICKTTNLIPRDVKREDEDAMMFAFDNIYLNPSYITLAMNQPMAGGTETGVDLSGLVGRLAWLMVVIKLAGSQTNVNNSYIKGIVSMGDRSLFDVKTSAGQSLMTNNTPWLGQWIQQEIMAENMPNNLNTKLPGFYPLPMGGNMQRQNYGQQDGFIYLDMGMKNRLTITPAVQVQQVDTVYKSNAAAYTSGNIQYQAPWCNDVSVPVPVTAAASVHNVAINAMPCMEAMGITATLQTIGYATASPTVTITYNTPRSNGLGPGKGGYSLVINPDNIQTASGQDRPTVMMTTAGVMGLPPTQANYDINVYGEIFQMVTHRGNFTTEVLPAPWYVDDRQANKMIAEVTRDER